MKYDLPDGWTCIACGKEYLKDTTGKQVADYSEGTICNKCRKENINEKNDKDRIRKPRVMGHNFSYN